jgi:DNA-binding response OmpR family regulator
VALVLVIDDDRTICEAIAVVVHQIGHEVRCASTFSQGLEESRSREFAVVLVMCSCPTETGWIFCRVCARRYLVRKLSS